MSDFIRYSRNAAPLSIALTAEEKKQYADETEYLLPEGPRDIFDYLEFQFDFNNYTEEKLLFGWWMFSNKLFPDEQKDVFGIISSYYWDLVYTQNTYAKCYVELSHIVEKLRKIFHDIKRNRVMSYIRDNNYRKRKLYAHSKKSGEIFHNVVRFQEENQSICELYTYQLYYNISTQEKKATKYFWRWQRLYKPYFDTSIADEERKKRFFQRLAKQQIAKNKFTWVAKPN